MASRIVSGIARKSLCVFMAVVLAWGLNPTAAFADELTGDDAAWAGGDSSGEQWAEAGGSDELLPDAAASGDAFGADSDADAPAEGAAPDGASASDGESDPAQDGVEAAAAGDAAPALDPDLGEFPEPNGSDAAQEADADGEAAELGYASGTGDVELFDPVTGASVGTLAETYSGSPLVAIVGAADDDTSRAAFEQASRIAASGQQSDVRFALLDAAGSGQDFASWVPDGGDGSVAAYSQVGSDGYAQWAAELFARCGGSPEEAAYPFVFALDGEGCITMYGCGDVDLAAVLEGAYGIVVPQDVLDGSDEASQESENPDAETPEEDSATLVEQDEPSESDGLEPDPAGTDDTDGTDAITAKTPDGKGADGPAQSNDDDVLLFEQASIGDLMLYRPGSSFPNSAFLATYLGKRVVVIVGSAGDERTEIAISQAYEMTQNQLFKDVHFAVFDYDGGGSAFADAYGSYENSRLKLYSRSGSSMYSDFAWDLYQDCSGSTGPISLPFVFAVNTSRKVIDFSTGLDRFPRLVAEAYGIDDPSYNSYDVDVTAQMQQTEARELLELVNAARQEAGAEPLTWDTELEETAMQRAAELTLLLSHMRPDGSSCFSAWPAGSECARENIAAGQQTAQQANANWLESEGDHANMIATDVTTFAAALVVAPDSQYGYYWVECFSTGDGTGFNIDAYDGESTFIVTVTESQASALSLYCDDVDVTDATIPAMDDLLLVGSALDLVPHMSIDGQSMPVDPTGLTWTSSDAAIASVSESGRVTAVSPGQVTITAALPNESLSVSCTVRVTGMLEESGVTPPEDRTYTRWDQTPKPTVTYGGKTLVEETDYTLEYTDNVNAGTATVTITGCGFYTGQVVTHFQIARRGWQGGNSHMSWPSRVRYYTGQPIEFDITVVVWGEILTRGLDYDIVYWDNVNAGEAHFNVILTRNYIGTLGGSHFTISPADIGEATVAFPQESAPYTGEPIEPPVTVTLGETTLALGTDYEVEYADNTEIGTAKATVTGQGNYAGTAEGTFGIVPIDISEAAVTVPDQTYTGSALEPAATVVVGGKTLAAGTDYDIGYARNVDAGEATVTVTGKDKYTGTATATFAIHPLAIGSGGEAAEGFTASLSSEHVYFKDNTRPAATLKRGGAALAAGADYQVTYSVGAINPAAGITSAPATATVVGRGNYKGSIKLPYEVYCRVVSKHVTGAGAIELRSPTLYPKGGDTVAFRTIPAVGQKLSVFNVTYVDPATGASKTLNVPNGGLRRTAGTGAAGTVAEYSFTMPDCDVAINVAFVANDARYPIRKSVSGTGAAGSNLMLVGSDGKPAGQTGDAVAPTMLPRAGQTVYFKSVPARGARLTKFNVAYTYTALDGTTKTARLVTGSGITSHGGGLYSFTMPCYPVTLTGEFTK